MKRIAIFCDGTWNRMAAEEPTNVLKAAQSVLSRGSDGVPQVVYYNEGVGTSHLINEWLETRLAGAFGWGLLDKVADAYRFLIFNYEPGDEIYIFGFSRGAFTARSLAGLIRKCGIIAKPQGRAIKQAFDFYRERDSHPAKDKAQAFRRTYSPLTILEERDRQWRLDDGASVDEVAAARLLNITYVGVWDTVMALGVPGHLWLSRLTRRIASYDFHNADLSSTVLSARHAVAVDEQRLSFRPTLWQNLPDLNKERGGGEAYKQVWFPGDHGSVGGGGNNRTLSNAALLWVLEGARLHGLAFNPTQLAEDEKRVNPFGALRNRDVKPGLLDRISRKGWREAPLEGDGLADSTRARLERLAGTRLTGETEDWQDYRPETLRAHWPITIGQP